MERIVARISVVARNAIRSEFSRLVEKKTQPTVTPMFQYFRYNPETKVRKLFQTMQKASCRAMTGT
jgi:hypothetical protein